MRSPGTFRPSSDYARRYSLILCSASCLVGLLALVGCAGSSLGGSAQPQIVPTSTAPPPPTAMPPLPDTATAVAALVPPTSQPAAEPSTPPVEVVPTDT